MAVASRWGCLIGLALANILLLTTEVSGLRMAAGLAMIFVLPGWAWLGATQWLGIRCALERVVLLGALSAAIAAAALLGAVYWPGPFDLAATLISLDLAILAGVAMQLLHRRNVPHAEEEDVGPRWPTARVGLALLAILALAAFLRWYTIGYGEFHEDEVENLRLAVRAMKGEEYAPFIDSKGPVHWLLPGALWMMHGWLNETVGRAPFAIASLLTVLAVYVLGRRVASSGAGLIASGFVAVNGFFVAYARHIENPSLIVLWASVAAWCLYRFYQKSEGEPGLATGALPVLAGLFLGVGLIAHPDVILHVLAAGLILAFLFWRNPPVRRHWRWLLAGLGLFLGLTVVFYIPFVNDPYFQHTREYLAGERIGTQLLYNQVADMLELDGLYSTRYYAPLLLMFSGILLVGALCRRGRWGTPLAALLVVAMLSTVYAPGLWAWGNLNGAILPYLLFFAALLFYARLPLAVKGLLVWFALPFLAMEFFAKDAADHIQIAYPAWCLLAGLGAQAFWRRLTGRLAGPLKAATAFVLAGCLGLILYYQHLQFLGTVADYWRAEADSKYNEQSVYRLLYGGLPRPRKLFSNPRLGGWKVVGYLYETGQLKGDFRSSKESFAVPIWYTYQTPRSCFEDPQNYFLAVTARGEPQLMQVLPGMGYGLRRIVLVDGQPRLYLFEKGMPTAESPQVYNLDDYIAWFDRSATPQRYTQEATPQVPLQVTFGEQLLLRGYDLSTTRLRPGQTLAVNLYWQARAAMNVRYRAFVHVETDRLWGQHDDDPVCRLRTDEWRPPQFGMGQFRVTLDPATPPGSYPLTVGIYDPDTWERLAAHDASGQALGTAVELTTITVE